ncbi:MAG TPA: hypothetical protein VIR65_04255 [Rhizorhapis sp.]
MTSLSFVCIATLIGMPAFAQDARSNVDQIGSSRSAGAQGVQQLSHRSREVQGSAAPAEGHLTAPQQLSTGAAKTPVATQLTREGKQAGAPVQLYRGGPTAQASEALSRPSDGRTGAVTPVTGEDRCDAAKQDKDKARQEACAKVIETRAAEFTRPDPTILSPEQRLLVDQRLREGPGTVLGASRRLARDADANADLISNQAVASVALQPPPTVRPNKPEEQSPELSAETQAVISAIVSGIGTGTAAPR